MQMRGRLGPSFLAALALLGPLPFSQAALSVEFRVNTSPTGSYPSPSVAMGAAGNFVVVWHNVEYDGDRTDIYGQRFDSSGKIGDEFQVNSYTTDSQYYPSVAMDPVGNFVVVWQSRQGGDGVNIFGQRYDRDGKVGNEFQANTYTTGPQTGPSVAMDAVGDFVVVWESGGAGIYGQRYDMDGKVGNDFQVTNGYQGTSDVAMDADGDFVVTWSGSEPGGELQMSGVFGQRYDTEGNKVGDELHVNTYTYHKQHNPSVGMDADGDFAVVWQSIEQDGDVYGVFGQRYDSQGNKVGYEFQVNTYTEDHQMDPRLAMAAGGDFAVVWESKRQGSDYEGVFGQRFDVHGKVGEEFQLNTCANAHQGNPALAMDAYGNFVAVWGSDEREGRGYGVYGKQFPIPEPSSLLLGLIGATTLAIYAWRRRKKCSALPR